MFSCEWREHLSESRESVDDDPRDVQVKSVINGSEKLVKVMQGYWNTEAWSQIWDLRCSGGRQCRKIVQADSINFSWLSRD